jgi:UDP-hydrolysing UDP-N-acetyl-D-glucosamine 2-epimerase
MATDNRQRTIAFVTGTRAEFGLMHTVLAAIKKHPRLNLQIIATGMHLDPAHGNTLASIQSAGYSVNTIIPWEADSGRDRITNARNTGRAIAALADAYQDLQPDIVLIVGDRVEAFAAASSAHIAGIPVAHVHGGDRAAGQVDDALRHAITKLSHIHFPATRQSQKRIHHLGEENWRITRAGSPGLDGIIKEAATHRQIQSKVGKLTKHKFALIVLHPADTDEAIEHNRAKLVLDATACIPFEQIVIVYPNNDPGSSGIMRCWEAVAEKAFNSNRLRIHRDLPRDVFLGLMREAAMLIGNSSSGIIEAASFGTPVVDIGARQKGRERGPNVTDVPYTKAGFTAVLKKLWNNGRPKRFKSENIYGGDGAGRIIAGKLASVPLNDRLLHKLIRY